MGPGKRALTLGTQEPCPTEAVRFQREQRPCSLGRQSRRRFPKFCTAEQAPKITKADLCEQLRGGEGKETRPGPRQRRGVATAACKGRGPSTSRRNGQVSTQLRAGRDPPPRGLLGKGVKAYSTLTEVKFLSRGWDDEIETEQESSSRKASSLPLTLKVAARPLTCTGVTEGHAGVVRRAGPGTQVQGPGAGGGAAGGGYGL